MGTGGSLEHLPGKTNGLSRHCWPDVVIGKLPNFYCYNASIGVEGIGVKRRNYAVVLDYLPSCIQSDYSRITTINRLGSFLAAMETNSQQVKVLREEIESLVSQMPEYLKIIQKEKSLELGIGKLKQRLSQSIVQSYQQKNHVWGEIPELNQQVDYIKESIDGTSLLASLMKKDYQDEYTYHSEMLLLISKMLN